MVDCIAELFFLDRTRVRDWSRADGFKDQTFGVVESSSSPPAAWLNDEMRSTPLQTMFFQSAVEIIYLTLPDEEYQFNPSNFISIRTRVGSILDAGDGVGGKTVVWS